MSCVVVAVVALWLQFERCFALRLLLLLSDVALWLVICYLIARRSRIALFVEARRSRSVSCSSRGSKRSLGVVQQLKLRAVARRCRAAVEAQGGRSAVVQQSQSS